MSHFNWLLDGSIVGVYLLVTMIAGLWVRKYVGKVEHFLVAGREMDVYLGIASLAATEFGIVTCMYTAQNGYEKGFAGATPGILMAIAMLVVGLTAGGTAAFYTFTTYMQTFVKLSVGLTEDQTTIVIFASLIFATILQPLYGALSDRIGRKPLLIFFGVAGTLATIPILTLLKDTKSPFIAFLLICAAWIFVAGYTSINAVVKAELFPTNVRALGVGVPYALTVSIFGGTAPAIALYFKTMGHESWFYYYLSGVIFLSLLIYATMRDTKHASAMHRHE